MLLFLCPGLPGSRVCLVPTVIWKMEFRTKDGDSKKTYNMGRGKVKARVCDSKGYPCCATDWLDTPGDDFEMGRTDKVQHG